MRSTEGVRAAEGVARFLAVGVVVQTMVPVAVMAQCVVQLVQVVDVVDAEDAEDAVDAVEVVEAVQAGQAVETVQAMEVVEAVETVQAMEVVEAVQITERAVIKTAKTLRRIPTMRLQMLRPTLKRRETRSQTVKESRQRRKGRVSQMPQHQLPLRSCRESREQWRFFSIT